MMMMKIELSFTPTNPSTQRCGMHRVMMVMTRTGCTEHIQYGWYTNSIIRSPHRGMAGHAPGRQHADPRGLHIQQGREIGAVEDSCHGSCQ